MKLLLDACCKAGGAAMGYHRAGFTVVGVDKELQPNYPFEFVKGDAIEFIRKYGKDFDAGHGSPPCQRHSTITRDRDSHPDLIDEMRLAYNEIGIPWVMENVMSAKPLRRDLMLCGEMFGLRVIRHRKFETWRRGAIAQPTHLPHRGRAKASGRRSRGTYSTEGHYESVYGHGTDKGATEQWRGAMGIDWMTRPELAEAIPPAYTEYIGRQLIQSLV